MRWLLTLDLALVPLDGGQAEIDELGDAAVGDEDIRPLDIAMGDALPDRELQALGHPEHQRHRLVRLDLAAEPEEIAEVHPLDVLHDHEVSIVLLSDVDDADDIVVAEPDPGLGLLVEPVDRIGDRGEPLAEHLDREGLPAAGVLAPVDPREGPLGEVEEHLGVAVEETRRVPLLEPLDLPAREPALAEQHPEYGVGRGILGIGRRLAESARGRQGRAS